jgi:hypothetical protein
MSTTIITENNYFEKVENPIQTTTNGIVEILKPITKSDILNVYYKVEEQLSKQKNKIKVLKKIVNAPNVFINHDYQKKVIKKTENENFVSEELKGKSVYSSSLLISDKTNEIMLRGIFEHKFKAGIPKILTYIYVGQDTENLKFNQEITASEAVANDLWTPSYFNPTEKITIGRGSVEKSEDCSFICPYISRVKYIKIRGHWYENIDCI